MSSGVRARVGRAWAPAAVAGLAGLSLAPQALAQSDGAALAQAAAREVTGVVVTAQSEGPASPKYTAPLLDTPQTITVISDQVIRAQNLMTLRDVLSTVPGITFGAGEGGGGYGDSVNLRGYTASNDITTDGLRDSAQYSRTDPFNIQQVEIVNGANSVYSGSGSTGGTINLVSKSPMGMDTSTVSAGLGADGYARLTLDTDRRLSDLISVRVNLMAHKNDAPGRDVETFERWGFAPSIAFGLDTPTRVIFSWFHQEDENIPQYGVPYYQNAFNKGPLPGADPSNYYGYANIDTQEIVVDAVTARFTHDFSDALTVRNITRYQRVTQRAVVDPPQGTFCLFSGINPVTGAACNTPGSYAPSGPRGNVRDTENTLLASQTDLTWRFETGSVRHTLTVGVTLAHETYALDTGNVLRNPLGALPNPTLPVMNFASPDHVYRGPVNYIRSGLSDSTLDNQAIYAFDTIELTPQWEISAGVRFEHNEGEFVATTYTVPYPAPPAQPVAAVAPVARNEDDLFSYRLGLVYKPVENASLYVAYGNAKTPSQASVNGGCAITGAAQNCNLDPEEAVNYEVGGKWDLYGGRLSLSAAVFRNERTNFRVASGDALIVEQALDGSSRVDGLALGIAGWITDKWQVFANYTFLDSEVLQSISDRSVAGGTIDIQKGDPLPVTPEHSASLWTTYQVTETLQLGYGATYSGEYTFARFTATSPLFWAPSYWVHNLAVTYNVTEDVDVQLNVKNLFDKAYYTRIRNNATSGWATPGDTRNATVSVYWRF